MAIRYGIPVSEFLARHTSAEITELYAHFSVKREHEQQPATKAPVEKQNPEAQAQILKSTLFKGN